MATFDDISQLSQLFQQSFSPVTNYSQGLLALAMDKRKRAEQEMDIANQQAFTLQRDKAQAALQERLEKSAHEAATARMKEAWSHADQSEKDKMLVDLRAQALQMKLPLAASSLTKEEQADYYNSQIGSAHALKATNLISQVRTLQQRFSEETSSDPRERLMHSTNLLLSSPAASVLTPQERDKLKLDPSARPAIIARLQKDKSKDGKMALNEFLTASSAADAQTDEMYAKYSRNPERVAQLVGEIGLARDVLGSILKTPNLQADVFANIFDAYGTTAKQIQGEQKKGPDFSIPSRPPGAAVVPSSAAPGGSLMDTGILPTAAGAIGTGVRGVTGAIGNFFASPEVGYGANQVKRALVGGPEIPYSAFPAAPPLNNPSALFGTGVPFIPPRVPAPAAPTPPDDLARLRLQKFLQDSAARSNTLFPLAYPAYNTNQFSAPPSFTPAP